MPELGQCTKCGSTVAIMPNGKLRGHWDPKRKKMCKGKNSK